MTEHEKQLETAVKNPELVIETPEQIMERERLEMLYYNSYYCQYLSSGYSSGKRRGRDECGT